MNKRRVAVVGIGTVNPAGNSCEESWKNVSSGNSCIGRIDRFDPDELNVGVTLAGEVRDFHLENRISKRDAKHEARFTQYALYAADEAIEMSGLKEENALSDDDRKRAGVIVSCGIGGLDVIEQQYQRGVDLGFDHVNPFFIPMVISNMAAARISISHGLKGISTCPVTACAGGTNAVGDAFHRIREGYEDIIVCGGTEACITKCAIAGFSNIRAMSHATDPKRASIPFDLERNGFIIGEGAGILVLEEWEHAEKRGANILAEIAGYGSNSDAYHITSPAPGGKGGAECLRLSLSDAEIEPDEIDYINAHGTSTKLNDSSETAAIHEVFKEHAKDLAVSSTKGVTGHLLGGAGGVEAVFTVQAIMKQFLPPTAGLKVPDPDCDLDYVPLKGRKSKINYALSNSLGFGGHNASVIFKKV